MHFFQARLMREFNKVCQLLSMSMSMSMSIPYQDTLKQLGLWTLEERRHRADLLEMFKMLTGKSSVKFESLFERSTLEKKYSISY